MTIALSVPEIDADADVLTAALAYAAAGWFVVPVAGGSKNPGSVVGGHWQDKSSRDPEVIVSWFAGTSHGIALHCGRSGAVVLDVDRPDTVPVLLADALTGTPALYQSTEDGAPGRGHHVYRQPPGRLIGNGNGDLGGAWGEVRGANGVIVVAPSRHQRATEGGRYRWEHTGPVPMLPDVLAAALGDACPAADAATEETVRAFLAEHTTAERSGLLAVVLRWCDQQIEAGASRHNTVRDAACWALREAAAGFYPAADATGALRDRLAVALAAEPGRHPGPEWAGILAWAVAQARAEDPEQTRAKVRGRVPRRLAADPDADPAPKVAALFEELRGWQHLPDPIPVLASLAVAVTASGDDGEPAWLLLVAAPSSGKTEIVRALDGAADARLDEVTIGGLLTWRTARGKAPVPSGVLTRVRHGLLTLGDLSTLLATSDRGGRDQVFAALRRVYDGRFVRDIATPGGGGTDGSLVWEGRLTVVGAVTGAIDGYTAHADALGARWVYCRLPARDAAAKRAASALARRGGLGERRARARVLVAEIVTSARSRLAGVRRIPDRLADVIVDASLVCCWGRASVPRHGYGRREIDGPVVVEEPMRVVRQLTTVAGGILALGQSTHTAEVICRRLALDSMPAARRAVLDVLALRTDNATTTATIARAAELHRHVARRALEDLEAVGVVHGERNGPEPPDDDCPDRRYGAWHLRDEDGALIGDVFGLPIKIIEWHEKGGTHTQHPPRSREQPDERAEAPHVSCHPPVQVSTTCRHMCRLPQCLPSPNGEPR